MTQLGSNREYDKKYKFAVEIDGLEIAWFESASGLEEETAVIEQHEAGGVIVANQSPGLTKFSPVTLMVGATDNQDLYTWRRQVVDAQNNIGQPEALFKKTVTILQLARDDRPLKKYVLNEAWPSKFKAAEFDAKADENVVQEVTLTYRFYVLQPGG